MAGPVCAAAVVLPAGFPGTALDDSKKLNPRQREEARRLIVEGALAWGIGWASHTEIDSVNILQASLLAMRRAFCLLTAAAGEGGAGQWPCSLETEAPFGRPFVPALLPENLNVIVDGLYVPDLGVPCTALVKADASVHEVMAASILAKTARDRLMEHYGRLYPLYGYAQHKGYPVKEHKKRIRLYGPSPIQRMSFRY